MLAPAQPILLDAMTPPLKYRINSTAFSRSRAPAKPGPRPSITGSQMTFKNKSFNFAAVILLAGGLLAAGSTLVGPPQADRRRAGLQQGLEGKSPWHIACWRCSMLNWPTR